MNFVLQQGSSFPPPPAYSQLKRGRTQDVFKFNPDLAPPLPPINSIDILLQVFTHRSIRRQSSVMGDTDYTDNERLSFVGELVLDTVLTDVLFKERPMLHAQQMTQKKVQLLSDETFDDWVSHYQLLGKLRCDLDLRLSASIKRPEETRAILHAYIGGVYIDSGMDAVHGWISRLLGQYLKNGSPSGPESMVVAEVSFPPLRADTPPLKKVKAEPMSPGELMPSIFFGSQPPPSPRQPPQPPPMSMPRHNPLAPAQPNLPFLPLFNQTAAQRRVSVEYTAQFSGPSHAGTWIVRCIVNGIPKGEGKGSSKQTAKEEAARQAFYAMGWT